MDGSNITTTNNNNNSISINNNNGNNEIQKINNINNNNIISNNNSNHEKLFWDIFRNKILMSIIFSFIKYDCQYSCIPLHSLNYLIDNNLIDIIKSRVLSLERLIINSKEDKKKIFKHKKLFKAITPSIKDPKFYKNLFTKYLKYFIQYDFDKLLDAIYESDNSIAISSLYNSFATLIDQNRLYSVDKIAQLFDHFLSSYHSFKVSTFILRSFYNHQQNNINYIKQKNQASNSSLNNNNDPLLIYSSFQSNNISNSSSGKNRNRNSIINFNSSSLDNKIITLDLIWNSIMNTVSKDREFLVTEQQKQESASDSIKDKKDKESNNDISYRSTLNWSIINKKYYKFINTLVNELNIPPPIQNFKFFSPESWRNLMSTIFCQCPFESNFKVKWLLEACKAIHSISFYIHEKECIEISKKNGGGLLRINNILNKSQLSDMVFSKYELNQRLNELDLLHPNNNKVVKLLKSYLEVSRLSSIYSKNIHYYCIFGNDDFQTIEFTSSTSIDKSAINNSSSNSNNQNSTIDNGLRINKYLFINSFKYAKYELLKEYLLRSNEKEPANYIITTLQEELENESLNNNNNLMNDNNNDDDGNKKSISLLFKYNNKLEQQLQFIYQFYNHSLLNENMKSTHKVNVSFLFSLIISTDNINLINKSVELFKDLIITNTMAVVNNNNNNHHNSNNNNNNNNHHHNNKNLTILNNYNNLFLYTKSSQTLIHLFELFNYQNYNTKELLNYQIFYFNGRLDLLALFEKLQNDSESLKFVSLKELNVKLNSKQFEHYLSACKYALKRNEIYEINLSALKETVLHSNYCKERYTNSKDIENIKYIIENTAETYKPLELVNHYPGIINLSIIKFFSWILKERSNDIESGRCQLNKAELKLLQYYTNSLPILPKDTPIPYSKFISDSKLVFEAIGSSGDFKSFKNIVNHYIRDNPKIVDQHQSIIKSLVVIGDLKVVELFNWENKFYFKTMVQYIFYNDHINLALEVFRHYSFSDTTLTKRISNKYSTLDFKKLYKDNYYNLT